MNKPTNPPKQAAQQAVENQRQWLNKQNEQANPPKQAGTTPSTDLTTLLWELYNATPRQLSTAVPDTLAAIQALIAQERNKAWEEATAKFEACLPEKDETKSEDAFGTLYVPLFARGYNEAIAQMRDNWYKGGER